MTENNILSQYLQAPNNLFALLARYRVTVPGIQRHYVQGADNHRARDVRESFISSIFNAARDNKDLHLHFIYGPIRTEGEDAFTPVDGQQRLTTLWLLARYASEKIEDKDERTRLLSLLARFSYSERTHATRFCHELTSNSHSPSWNINQDPKVSIPIQQWFWDYWREDETVSSMLEMLSTIHNKWDKGFSGKDILNFIAKNAIFELKVDSFGDDIYMKMNARGLQLTQWENFKGRFADLLSRNGEDTYSPYVEEYLQRCDLRGKSVKDAWNIQIERLSNIFYDSSDADESSAKELPDNAFFALIARLAVYTSGNRCGSQIRTLSTFTSEKWTNATLPYVPFDDFKNVFIPGEENISEEDKGALPDINDFAVHTLSLLENVLASSNIHVPYWTEKRLINTFFHPKNINECDFSLACLEYFSVFQQPSSDIEIACRFMWNILENVARTTVAKGEDKRKEWNRVYIIRDCVFLNNPTLYPADAQQLLQKNSPAPAQLIEEVNKALLYHGEENRPSSWEGVWEGWEKAIRTAEEYAFFHGAIRFLFLDAKGSVSWSNFGTKWRNAQAYFYSGGIRNEFEENGDCKLLRRLIAFFDSEKDFKEIFFDNDVDNWRTYVLLNGKLTSKVHQLLMDNDVNDFDYTGFHSNISDKYVNYLQTYLVNTKILTKMVKGCEYHYLGDKETGCILYPSNAKADWKKYIISPRLKILISLRKNSDIDFRFQDENLNKDEFLDAGILWGWNTAFYYRKEGVDYRFVWQWWRNWVDMYEGEDKLWDKGDKLVKEGKTVLGQKYIALHSHFTDEPDHDNAPHFSDADSLIKELDRCVMIYQQIKNEANTND